MLDCGLFHVFTDADRRLYEGSLRAALEPGGRYFLLCFSDRQPGQWGPVRKITREEITATFAGGWQIDSIQAASIDSPPTRPASASGSPPSPGPEPAPTARKEPLMPAAEARIPTPNAGRYLARLGQHAGKMGSRLHHQPRNHTYGGAPPAIRAARWSGTDATLDLDRGRCTLHAEPGLLMLRAEADSEDNLTQIQDLIARRLQNFGRREHLTVTWQPAQAPGGTPDTAAGPGTGAADAGSTPAP